MFDELAEKAKFAALSGKDALDPIALFEIKTYEVLDGSTEATTANAPPPLVMFIGESKL